MIKRIVESEGHQVKFHFARANSEFGVYILTKVDGKAKITAEGASNAGGFEMY